mgnify:CR=1 FL=1
MGITDFFEYDENDKTGVLEYMGQYSGLWYDPEIFDVFVRIVNQML